MNRKPNLRAALRSRFMMIIAVLALAAFGCKAAQGQWPADRPAASPAATSSQASIAAAPPKEATAPAVNTGAGSGKATLPATQVGPTPETQQPTPATLVPEIPQAPEATPDAQLEQPLNGPTPTLTLEPTLPFTPDPAATQRQMQVFDELWGTIRENYLYPDFNGLDWQAARQEYTSMIQAGMGDRDFYLAMGRLVRSLGDEHSSFFDPTEAAEQDARYAGEYNYVGIGVLSALAEGEDHLTVVLVFPGSPAEEAGIKMRDRLLMADGEPLVDADGARVNKLRGEEGTSVTLQVQTPGEAVREVTIVRRQVNSVMPIPHMALTTPQGKRIGYIFIPTFYDSNVDEGIASAIETLSAQGPLDGLILDNRQNPGGASPVLVNSLGLFTDGVVGYFAKQREQMPLEVEGLDVAGSQTLPLVVMVGEGSASFGEVFSGVLKDLGRAYVIGVTSPGNVEILNVFDFSDGSRAWIATTTFKPLNNPDANWEETGIIPDLQVPADWDETTTENDPAVLAALQYFDTR